MRNVDHLHQIEKFQYHSLLSHIFGGRCRSAFPSCWIQTHDHWCACPPVLSTGRKASVLTSNHIDASHECGREKSWLPWMIGWFESSCRQTLADRVNTSPRTRETIVARTGLVIFSIPNHWVARAANLIRNVTGQCPIINFAKLEIVVLLSWPRICVRDATPNMHREQRQPLLLIPPLLNRKAQTWTTRVGREVRPK